MWATLRNGRVCPEPLPELVEGSAKDNSNGTFRIAKRGHFDKLNDHVSVSGGNAAGQYGLADDW